MYIYMALFYVFELYVNDIGITSTYNEDQIYSPTLNN